METIEKMEIRLATLKDAKVIYEIYEPYILNTVITFEYDRVPLQVFTKRIEKVMEKLPWLVCTINDVVVGYAYCSPHLERAAFSWDCECSIYIHQDYHKKGIGTALYDALFQIVKEQGYYNIYTLICVPHESSVALHKKYGFTEVGTYYNTAYKLGQWRHLLVMEKKLNQQLSEPGPVIPVYNLDKGMLKEIFKEVVKQIKKAV